MRCLTDRCNGHLTQLPARCRTRSPASTAAELRSQVAEMHWVARAFLITESLAVVWYVAYGLSAYGFAAHPEDRHHLALGLFGGCLVSSPLWVPAMIPTRFEGLLSMTRVVGAVILLLPAIPITFSIVSGASEAIDGSNFFSTPATMLLLLSVLLAPIFILLWPFLGGHS